LQLARLIPVEALSQRDFHPPTATELPQAVALRINILAQLPQSQSGS
jgi:hypothetical protein